MWERLDRGFVNTNWINNHSSAAFHNFLIIESDHGLITISTSSSFPKIRQPNQFEMMWTLDKGCGKIIKVI